MIPSVEEILENVAVLITFLEDNMLWLVDDIPFLEMAKHVSVTQRNALPPCPRSS